LRVWSKDRQHERSVKKWQKNVVLKAAILYREKLMTYLAGFEFNFSDMFGKYLIITGKPPALPGDSERFDRVIR